jgi:hypothetical protein
VTVFRPHEVEVVRLLAGSQLPPAVLEGVIAGASFVELEETGCGYFLTVQHSALPAERVVCSKPLVHGQAGDLTCGFVLFLEDGLLTLECHSWGEESIPLGFRDYDVEVGITA